MTKKEALQRIRKESRETWREIFLRMRHDIPILTLTPACVVLWLLSVLEALNLANIRIMAIGIGGLVGLYVIGMILLGTVDTGCYYIWKYRVYRRENL